MKRIIIISLALLLEFSLQSQEHIYESIFDSSIISWAICQFAPSYRSADDIELYVNIEDSLVIDSNKYYYISGGAGVHTINFETDLISLFLRESEDHSKLFFRTNHLYGGIPYMSEEIMVMDLNMEVGDTLDHFGIDSLTQYLREYYNYSMSQLPNFPLIIADSIYYRDGKKHIRTNYTTNITRYAGQDTLTFIEGVGPSQGPLYWRYYIDKFYDVLACCFKNGKLSFRNRLCEIARTECTLGSICDNIDIVDNNIYLVYPNPAREAVEICGLDNSLHNITIVSSAGQEVIKTTSYANNVKINISNLPTGLYLVYINQNAIGKIIKQ